jgi:hypothetical protein
MQTLLTLFNEKEKKRNTLFFSSSLLLFLFSLASFLAVLLLLKPSTSSISIYQKNILLLYLLINPIGFLAEHILLLRKRFRNLVVFGIISFAIPPIIISIPILYGHDITFSFYALITWATLKLIYVFFSIKDTREIRHKYG